MKIRFCEHNKGKGKVYRRLKEEFPDMNIKIKDCIKQCGVCSEMLAAPVDKKKVTAPDGDALYEQIVAMIQKEADNQ